MFLKAAVPTTAIFLFTGLLLTGVVSRAILFAGESTKSGGTLANAQTLNQNNPGNAIELPHVPSIVFKDGKGTTIDISQQRGKVLFINFWATWCPPCIEEMPSINALRKELNEKEILFLMVDVDDNYKKSSRFMEVNKYNLPVYTPVSSIPPEFLSGAIPTTIIINKEGKVVGRHEGGADYMAPDALRYFKSLTDK